MAVSLIFSFSSIHSIYSQRVISTLYEGWQKHEHNQGMERNIPMNTVYRENNILRWVLWTNNRELRQGNEVWGWSEWTWLWVQRKREDWKSLLFSSSSSSSVFAKWLGWAVVYQSSAHLVLRSLHALWELLDLCRSTHLVHTVAHSLKHVALYSRTVAVSVKLELLSVHP